MVGRVAVVGVMVALLIVPGGQVRPAAADGPICTPVVRICAKDVAGLATKAIPGLAAAKAALDKFGGVAASAAENVVGAGVAWFTDNLLSAAGQILVEPGGFVTAATRPPVTAASFVGPGGAYHEVASFAVVLLVGLIFLGVIQGLLAGEPGQSLFRVVRDTPVAVLAILGFPWLVAQLLDVSDGLSAAVLPSADVLRGLLDTHVFTAFTVIGSGLPQMLLALLAFAATVLVFVELVVRAALVMVVVGVAPLSFAGIVWPAARPAARKVAELTVAAVLAKPAIYIALKVGLDMVGQQTPGGGGPGWGSLLVGVTVLCVASFAPWVVWRLLPLAEAFVVAQGVSRMPARGGMQVLQTAYWADMIHSRTGGRRGGGRSRRSGPDGGLGPEPVRLASLRGGGSGGGGRGQVGRVGAAAASTAGTAATVVAAPVAAAKAGKDHVAAAADRQSTPPAAGGGAAQKGRPSDGWFRRPPGGQRGGTGG